MSYALASMDRVRRAVAQELVDAFKQGEVLAAYGVAHRIAPKLFPERDTLAPTDRNKVADLVADCFLLLDAKQRRG